MREDYTYVNKATDICLVLTPIGEHNLKKFVDYLDTIDPEDYPLQSMLAFIENSYVVLEDPLYIDISIMYDCLKKQYKKEFDYDLPDNCQYEFSKAFCGGLIGIRKVIWG